MAWSCVVLLSTGHGIRLAVKRDCRFVSLSCDNSGQVVHMHVPQSSGCMILTSQRLWSPVSGKIVVGLEPL